MSAQAFNIDFISDPERGAVRMSCQNAGCEQERDGWAMVLDPSQEKHRKAIDFIEKDSGRKYLLMRSEDAANTIAHIGHTLDITHVQALREVAERTPPGMLLYVFSRGQQCFRRHLDREVAFIHRQPRGQVYVHANHKDFEEDFNITADAVGVLAQRG